MELSAPPCMSVLFSCCSVQKYFFCNSNHPYCAYDFVWERGDSISGYMPSFSSNFLHSLSSPDSHCLNLKVSRESTDPAWVKGPLLAHQLLKERSVTHRMFTGYVQSQFSKVKLLSMEEIIGISVCSISQT